MAASILQHAHCNAGRQVLCLCCAAMECAGANFVAVFDAPGIKIKMARVFNEPQPIAQNNRLTNNQVEYSLS